MTTTRPSSPTESPLGKATKYIDHYAPELLFPVDRQANRNEIGIHDQLPFYGVDVWNLYEISFLNAKGKPIAAIGRATVPCESPYIIESKSFKLYLNSLNQTSFDSLIKAQQTIQKDLSEKAGKPVEIILWNVEDCPEQTISRFSGSCLDPLDIDTSVYQIKPEFLFAEGQTIIEERLHSNLLKSNCMITGQPDWGSVEINYRGKKINHEGLLRYIISFRDHHEFHEPCVERIFMNIMQRCQPEKLTVEAHYTRRGGLDICPIRSTEQAFQPNYGRFIRQ